MGLEFYRKKNIWISIATVLATIINIGLNFILLPYCGYLVAAYTTLIGFAFMVIFHIRIVKKQTSDSEIYDEKAFVVSTMIVIIMMGVSLVSYVHFMIRLLMIFFELVVVIYICVKNKETFMNLTKVIRRTK